MKTIWITSLLIAFVFFSGCAGNESSLQEGQGEKPKGASQESPSPTSVGNGGFVVECSAGDSKTNIFFYDYYEFSQNYFRLMPVDPNDLDITYQDHIEAALRIFDKVDAVTSKRLRSYVEHVFENTVFLTEERFLESFPRKTQDLIDITSLGQDCALKQGIVQMYKNKQSTVYFNQNLFDAMSELNKAFAVIHEAVYFWLLKENLVPDSSPVRHFVHFLMADYYASIDSSYSFIGDQVVLVPNVLYDPFKTYHVYAFEAQSLGLPYITYRSKHYGDLKLNLAEYIKFCPGIQWGERRLTSAHIDSLSVNLGSNGLVALSGRQEFYCDGHLKRVTFSKEQNISIEKKKVLCVKALINREGEVVRCER